MKIIFLDFDGVLVNKKSWYVRSGLQATADPPCVAALNRITDATGALIVVSSTWRLGTKVIELRELLAKWGVTGKVLDRTPVIETKSGHIFVGVTRGQEIKKWLDNYPRPIEAFVIIDDDADMDELSAKLVKTQFDDGLTDAHVGKAIALLTTSREASDGSTAGGGLGPSKAIESGQNL